MEIVIKTILRQIITQCSGTQDLIKKLASYDPCRRKIGLKTNKYSYRPLSTLQANTKINVYGVVKFVKQPYKSRGSDYCMMLSIVDQSFGNQEEKLKCLLFAKEESKLPPAQVGDVIRFHRLTISRFAGDLQGQSSPGFSWILFSGDPGGTLDPKATSSQTFTLPDEEKDKIEDLRTWASGHGLAKTYSKFKNIAAGCYFDIICQVISTCVIEEDVCLLLQVWDGTQTIYSVRELDTSSDECHVNSDAALMSKAEGFVYDLCLFDDHVKMGLKIKPGDFIELCNLHAAVFNKPDDSPLETVELVLHRGTSFGRGVKLLPTDVGLPELKKLKEALSRICAISDSGGSLSDTALLRAAEECQKGDNSKREVRDGERPSTSRNNNIERKQVESVQKQTRSVVSKGSNHKRKQNDDVSSEDVQIIESVPSPDSDSVQIIDSVNSDERVPSGSKISYSKRQRQDLDINPSQHIESVENSGRSLNQPSSSGRCMLKTSTVILNHPHIKKTCISDILKHEIPFKFRVRARVYDYHPKPDSVNQFLQLYCHECHYLCPLPGVDTTNNNSTEESQLMIGSTFKGVPHYNCPRCLEDNSHSLQGLDSPPHLSYIYMMRLLLRDDTGWLLANIWKNDAETFLRDIQPEELIQDKKQLKLIKECLHEICPDSNSIENKPWIECCVRSYSNKDGTGYQIFDTVIA